MDLRQLAWQTGLAIVLSLAACQVPLLAAAPTDAEIEACIADLDSASYEVRQQAKTRLGEWSADEATARRLSMQVHQALHRAETSFEVRAVLAELLDDLPRVDQAATADAAEIERLLDLIDSDVFAEREGAAARIEWLLTNPKLAGPIATQLKSRLAQPELSRELSEQYQTLWRASRRAWLLSDPAEWDLPSLDAKMIDAWVATLSDAGASEASRRSAEQELLDALPRDEFVPQVRDALEHALADPELGAEPQARLKAILDWTKPAMVAEYWHKRHHTGIQHLYVDVPSQPAGVPRASHFDRIDDRTAHCVSGNALSPGDYPVGVFFPHPTHRESQFHLVNLPTPRRRMRYEEYNQIDEKIRMAEITKRTCDTLAAAKSRLSGRAIEMLVYLDPPTVSKFAAKLLNDVDDAELDTVPGAERLGAVSHHNLLCYVLAGVGTGEAVDPLLEALRRGRIEKPILEAPFNMPAIAVLAMIAREPNAGGRARLGPLIDSDDPLVLGEENGPTFGASAAALLLREHGKSPESLGLEACGDDSLVTQLCPSYRYGEGAKQRVAEWVSSLAPESVKKPREGIDYPRGI